MYVDDIVVNGLQYITMRLLLLLPICLSSLGKSADSIGHLLPLYLQNQLCGHLRMPVKNFEQVVRFYEARQDPNGPSVWLPLVDVTLITPANSRVSLPLLFDTGASVTTLRADLYPILGLQSWDQGIRVETDTAGGRTAVYRYTYTLG